MIFGLASVVEVVVVAFGLDRSFHWNLYVTAGGPEGSIL
jgi:hypothetical protein